MPSRIIHAAPVPFVQYTTSLLRLSVYMHSYSSDTIVFIIYRQPAACGRLSRQSAIFVSSIFSPPLKSQQGVDIEQKQKLGWVGVGQCKDFPSEWIYKMESFLVCMQRALVGFRGLLHQISVTMMLQLGY